MEFQVIDYAEEKLPLFLFLYHLDSTDLHCQRPWISEALALHQTGFFMSGGQTQPDSDSPEKPGQEQLHGKDFFILLLICVSHSFILFLLLSLAQITISVCFCMWQR